MIIYNTMENYQHFYSIQELYLQKINLWMSVCELSGDSIKSTLYNCLILKNKFSLSQIDDIIKTVNNNNYSFKQGNIINILVDQFFSKFEDTYSLAKKGYARFNNDYKNWETYQINNIKKTSAGISGWAIYEKDFNNSDFSTEILKTAKYYETIKNLFTDLSNETPSCLNQSPNACCGKWELLYRLLRPNSRSPVKGDIIDGSLKLEFKGKQTRFFNKSISGKLYHQNLNNIMIEYNYIPNKLYRKDSHGFEPEKYNYQNHYKQQFDEDIQKSKNLHFEIFKCMKLKISQLEVDEIFENNEWNYTIFRKYIVFKLGEKMWNDNNFDELWIFGNGENLKIIKNKEQLKLMVFEETLNIKEDYFRIHQTNPIGWYVE